MSAYIEKARLYISQERYSEALDELHQALSAEPNNSEVYAMLAICFSETDDHQKATEAAEQAIGLEPDHPFGYYVASRVSLARGNPKAAKGFIDKAIGLNPYNANFFSQLAVIHISSRRWNEALAAAEEGLDLDPEDVDCQNIRSIALNRLGRHEDAGVSIEQTLQQSPDNPITHANMGWELLNQGKAKESLNHFKEALRLDPNLEYARLGIVEAMKGQFFLYRIFLNWFLFCQKLSGKYLMGILIGGYIGYQFCLSLMNNNPALKPFLLPLVIGYIAFAIMTWISTPLFNLVLRTSRFGRLVLTEEEKRTSTWVGVVLLFSLAFLIPYCVTGNFIYAAASIACAITIPLISTYYASSKGWPRAIHAQLLIAILSMGVITLACILGELLTTGPLQLACSKVGGLVVLPFMYSAIASQFAVNFLVMARPRLGTGSERNAWLVGGAVLVLLAVTFSISAYLIISESFKNYDRSSSEQLMEVADLILGIDFQQTANAQWSDQAAVDSLTREIQGLGFESICDVTPRIAESDFSPPSRYLRHPKSNLVALIDESSEQELQVTIAGLTSQNQLTGTTNQKSYGEFLSQKSMPTTNLSFVAGNAGELFTEAKQKTETSDLREITEDSIIPFHQRINLLSVLIGLQENIQRRNQKTAGSIHLAKVLKYVFLCENPEFFDKRKALIVINKEVARIELAFAFATLALVNDTLLSGPNPAAEIVDQHSAKPSSEFRQEIKKRLKSERNFEFLGVIKSPLETDVYFMRR